VDLERGECFGFLGFEFRYLRGLTLQLPFRFEVCSLSDRLMSSTPE